MTHTSTNTHLTKIMLMYRHTIWSRSNLEPQDLFDLLHNGGFGSILTGTVFQFQSILLSVCFESALSLLHYRNHSI